MTEQENEKLKQRIENAKQARMLHHIIAVVVDVLYGLHFELESVLALKGLKLKHQEKYKFNLMLENIKKVQKQTLGYTQHFIKGVDDDSIDAFCDKSDDMTLVIKTFFSKYFKSDKNQDKIVKMLLELESSQMFTQSVMQLEEIMGFVKKEKKPRKKKNEPKEE